MVLSSDGGLGENNATRKVWVWSRSRGIVTRNYGYVTLLPSLQSERSAGSNKFVECSCACLVVLGLLDVIKQNEGGIQAEKMGVNEVRVTKRIEPELMPTLLVWPQLRLKVRYGTGRAGIASVIRNRLA